MVAIVTLSCDNLLWYVNVEGDQAGEQGRHTYPQTLADCTGIAFSQGSSNYSDGLLQKKSSVLIPVVKITRKSCVRRIVACDSAVWRFLSINYTFAIKQHNSE